MFRRADLNANVAKRSSTFLALVLAWQLLTMRNANRLNVKSFARGLKLNRKFRTLPPSPVLFPPPAAPPRVLHLGANRASGRNGSASRAASRQCPPALSCRRVRSSAGDRLAIEDERAHAERAGSLDDQRLSVRPIVPVASEQTDAGCLPTHHHAEPVVLVFVRRRAGDQPVKAGKAQ